MPTKADFNALSAATTNQWVTNYQDSGVQGWLFTDKTDSSKVLFFPVAGRCYDGSCKFRSSSGDYWSSSLDSTSVDNGMSLNFNSGGCVVNEKGRSSGRSVRGVTD